MTTPRLLAVAAALGLGGAAFSWSYGRLGGPAVPDHPVLDCPDEIDVGEQELYSQAVGRFTLTNRGGCELVVSDVRTGCSCTGFERERDGHFFRADEVRLGPGESAALAIRRGVTGPVGGPIDSVIRFRTNDPAAAERAVRLVVPRITGGVETLPRSVVCGTVPVGSVTHHQVDVTDEAVPPRPIERVTSSDPDRVRVTLLPPGPVDPTAVRGVPVARLEVTVAAAAAGTIDERVEIHLAGRGFPTVVPVAATAAAAVQLVPAAVALPRRAGGELAYTAECLCRSARGGAVSAVVESCPPDLSVAVAEAAPGSGRSVRVTWNPDHPAAKETAPRTVLLKVTADGVDHPVSLTVHCQQPRGS